MLSIVVVYNVAVSRHAHTCMYTQRYTNTDVQTQAHVHTHNIHMHMYTCLHMCMNAHVSYTYKHTRSKLMSTHMRTYMTAHTYISTFKDMPVPTHMHICTYRCTCVIIYAREHRPAYMQVHTYTHAHANKSYTHAH